MDFPHRMMNVLWEIVEKNKKCSVNVSSFEDKLTVRILRGKKAKSFSHHDDDILISQLRHYLSA